MDYAFDTRCASGRAIPRGVSPTASCASSTCRTCTGSSTGRLDCLSGATEEGAGEVFPREASAGFTRRVMAMTEVISDCDFSGISDCDGNCGESVMVTCDFSESVRQSNLQGESCRVETIVSSISIPIIKPLKNLGEIPAVHG